MKIIIEGAGQTMILEGITDDFFPVFLEQWFEKVSRPTKRKPLQIDYHRAHDSMEGYNEDDNI